VRFNTLVESGARRFTYLYDFGDGWEHMVKNEDLVMPAAEGMKIRYLARENACPLKSSAAHTPTSTSSWPSKIATHEEHASTLQLIGGSFDQVAFNIEDVNERLGAIKA
jgi:hypothetical protein